MFVNLTIDTSQLEADLSKLITRIESAPERLKTTEVKSVPDVTRSRPRVLVPESWREYYNTELPNQPDIDKIASDLL